MSPVRLCLEHDLEVLQDFMEQQEEVGASLEVEVTTPERCEICELSR